MSGRSWIAALLVLGLLAGPALAADEKEAPETTPAVQKAESLYKAGQIAEARDAFAALSKADPENEELKSHVERAEQILELQSFLDTEDVSPGWERGVVILHAFFHRQEMPEIALAHDRKMHVKADSATTASLVAETLLVLDRNQEAASFVAGLREGQKNDQNRIYGGIALARLGKQDEVRKDIELYGMPKTKDPGVLYDLARLRTLLGDREDALTTLTAAFESCPARALDGLKGLAKSNADFATLRERHAEAFGKVLETASKASGCGGGCGGCDQQKSGGCDGCPKSGEKSEGCSGSCAGKGDCENCPEKGKCCGACKTGGECTEDCDCPNKKKSAEAEKEGCCGSCK